MTGPGYRIGGLAAVLGVAVTVVAFVAVEFVQDPFADVSTETYMTAIVGARYLWLAAHLGVAFGALLKLAGLLTVGDSLSRSGPVGRMANGFAVAGVTMLVVTMARDGYVHEYLARSWGGDPAWVPVFAGSLRTSYGVELMAVLALYGFAPACYGLAMLLDGERYPRWLGWLGVGGGAGAAVTAGYLWLAGPTTLGYGILYPLFAALLPLVWLTVAGLRLGKLSVDSAETA
ncbi:hypothetical protein Lfu02_39880 [Longispora fulva]|uniref:DUF4386 family protein n=1 Tax=Longispora fulva TaxID=619741 RepID=A0A8J7GD58_9ACTN|nr:hypothetical protein [Longispora fulva]MBG6136449.1 hypothetical protein [Longispora fulva]GIG59616.1 hypothetical protein Lfu02_39880 [Longispora fulva]